MRNDLMVIILIAAGAVLIYAAVKDKTPGEVMREALKGQDDG